MKHHVLIMAAGEGIRAGGEMPKQFRELLGIPMLWWSVRKFHRQNPEAEICIVLHPGYFDLWDHIYENLPQADKEIPVRLICGGRNRTHSVMNGLMHIELSDNSYVAVHDAARPMVTESLIARTVEKAVTVGTAIPCCNETNSLRRITGRDETVAVNRNDFLIVQTPQIFRADIIKKAYDSLAGEGSYTDDASMVQESGYAIGIVEGDPANIKVTCPDDFIIAEALLKRET